MSISYEAIGQVMVTCQAGENVLEGQVVKMNGNDTVVPCAAGETFCGVAGDVAEDGFVAVQVKGFVTVPCADSTVTAGYMNLAADGNGGVKAGGDGNKILVMNVEDGSAVICL